MKPPTPLSRFCIHTMTTKPWSLEECAKHYPTAGATGITVWRQHLQGQEPQKAGAMLRDAGLEIVSLCRGGFFPGPTSTRRAAAIDDNLRAIEEAHALGAPLIVLVCGAVPGQPLEESRKQIADGIARVLPVAVQAGVKLAIEPLHPMYADDRSAINTTKQANDVCDALGSPEGLGIAVDVYHVWWDDALEANIKHTAEKNRLFAFHACDWKTPTTDILNDRGLMGEGCIPIRKIKGWVEEAGFTGHNEVEIFSTRYWGMDQGEYLGMIAQAYQEHVH
ncbi:sugar phosphate isomerase/epimerase [Roseimicrobium gellanilyticum]|uniref:Sugar phosphate isomerase/epimerase n=1 Tax=Roseimicrobium gellanilyticum TaxID=748857 RepID=A0A366HTS9_9BACT|nr:sugar phosphate isomerase/epimerase family protein [Roseimicrobium gellanilyticum]RBP46107.1 sugar phosphate isomerase/epimerase [Roseimicrobium gellanilyticum]